MGLCVRCADVASWPLLRALRPVLTDLEPTKIVIIRNLGQISLAETRFWEKNLVVNDILVTGGVDGGKKWFCEINSKIIHFKS